MAKCVCGHIKGLHKKGVCISEVNPCGCHQFETEEQADKPAVLPQSHWINQPPGAPYGTT